MQLHGFEPPEPPGCPSSGIPPYLVLFLPIYWLFFFFFLTSHSPPSLTQWYILVHPVHPPSYPFFPSSWPCKSESLSYWNVKVRPLYLIILYCTMISSVSISRCVPAQAVCPLSTTSMLPVSFSFSQPIIQTKKDILPFTESKDLAGRRFGLDWGSVWGSDAACGMQIDDHCPMIWMPLTYCHCFHSAVFSSSHFHFYLVSESSYRKANRFLPRENILKILLLHFPNESEWRWSSWRHLCWSQSQQVSTAGSWPLGQQHLLS